MSEDIDDGPVQPDEEMLGFARDLTVYLGGQINIFAHEKGISLDEIPLQPTLIALGSLVAAGMIQQPQADRSRWLRYVIDGITTGTGVVFMIAEIPPEQVMKMAGAPPMGERN